MSSDPHHCGDVEVAVEIVVDNGEPGRGDTFEIALGIGYPASGTLGAGSIQINK
jgi:hypothetical protein